LSVLQGLVGRRLLTELCLTGEPIDARQALACGLVNSVVEDLDAGVQAVLGRVLDRSPAAIRRGLYLLKQIESMPFEQSIAFTESQIALFALTDDAADSGEERESVVHARSEVGRCCCGLTIGTYRCTHQRRDVTHEARGVTFTRPCRPAPFEYAVTTWWLLAAWSSAPSPSSDGSRSGNVIRRVNGGEHPAYCPHHVYAEHVEPHVALCSPRLGEYAGSDRVEAFCLHGSILTNDCWIERSDAQVWRCSVKEAGRQRDRSVVAAPVQAAVG